MSCGRCEMEAKDHGPDGACPGDEPEPKLPPTPAEWEALKAENTKLNLQNDELSETLEWVYKNHTSPFGCATAGGARCPVCMAVEKALKMGERNQPKIENRACKHPKMLTCSNCEVR